MIPNSPPFIIEQASLPYTKDPYETGYILRHPGNPYPFARVLFQHGYSRWILHPLRRTEAITLPVLEHATLFIRTLENLAKQFSPTDPLDITHKSYIAALAAFGPEAIAETKGPIKP